MLHHVGLIRFKHFTLLVVMITGLLTGCMDAGEVPRTSQLHQRTPPPTGSRPVITPPLAMGATPPPASAVPLDNARSRAVARLLDGEPGIIGVVMARPGGDVLVSRNAETPFVSASLYKLVLLADIYQRIETGEIALSDRLVLQPEYFPGNGELPDGYWDNDVAGSSVTIEEALFATGAYSSNVGARALLSLTTPASLEAMAQRLGLVSTHLFVTDVDRLADWPPEPGADATAAEVRKAVAFIEREAASGPVNITTPRDMVHFFELLWNGQVVSPSVSAEIMDILRQQAVDDRFPYFVPPSAILAHKTGNLDHVVHDVGIIQAPDGPIFVAAMIENALDDDRATQIIQRLALIAFGTYDVPPLGNGAVPEDEPAA